MKKLTVLVLLFVSLSLAAIAATAARAAIVHSPDAVGMAQAATSTPTPTATPVPVPKGNNACIMPTVVPVQTAVVSNQANRFLPVDDTHLCESSPTTNFGAISILKLAPNCTTLMKWTGLNAYRGKTVTKATLRLFVLGQPLSTLGGYGQRFFIAEPILAVTTTHRTISWVELQSTWTYRVPGTNWYEPGARGLGHDIAATLPSGYINIAPGWVDTPLWIPLVQSWIDSPATNFGIAIMNENASIMAQVASSEWAVRGFRPQLVLTLR